MPKALTDEGGESERIPIKVPRGMRELLKGLLEDGETISSLTRQLWVDEIVRRSAQDRAAKACTPTSRSAKASTPSRRKGRK
jgi:hypothetical protein